MAHEKTMLSALLFSVLSLPLLARPPCPTEMDSAGCLYFKEGYKSGKRDAEQGAENDYAQPTAAQIRFEAPFLKGYLSGWDDETRKKNKKKKDAN